MKRFSPLCFAAIMTTVICWGCSKQNVGWNKFNSQEGEFSVLFPGQPKEGVENAYLKVLHTVVYEEDKRIAYMVFYSDVGKQLLKDGADKFYDNARSGIIATSGNILLSEKAITLGEISGREMEVKVNNDEYFSVVRVFLSNDRLYQVIVTVPKENRDSTNILYFLSSFRLSAAK